MSLFATGHFFQYTPTRSRRLILPLHGQQHLPNKVTQELFCGRDTRQIVPALFFVPILPFFYVSCLQIMSCLENFSHTHTHTGHENVNVSSPPSTGSTFKYFPSRFYLYWQRLYFLRHRASQILHYIIRSWWPTCSCTFYCVERFFF